MTNKEKYEDIRDQLQVVVDISKVPILETEIRTIASRLVPFHSKELFGVIQDILGERFFPSGWELESRARKALGLPANKGLTEEMIEKNERELVVTGTKPELARKGADFMRNTLRKTEIPSFADLPQVIDPALGNDQNYLVAKIVEDPLAALEEFDEPAPNVLADLESFD